MKKFFIGPMLLLCSCALVAQSITAADIIKRSTQAMGGESLLNAITSSQWSGRGHEYIIEQSERQEAPYRISYFITSAEKNFPANKCLYTIAYSTNQRPYKLLVDGEKAGALIGKNYLPMYPETDEQVELSVERILKTASEGQPVYQGDSIIQGLKHHIVAFNWRSHPVRLFINAYTYLPAAFEVTRFYTSNFNNVWGDTKRLTLFSFWQLENNGLHYPHQCDVFVNQMHFRSVTIDSVKFNLALGVDTLSFPDSSYAKMREMQKMIDPLQKPVLSSKEIVSGVYQIPGNWNTAYIPTKNGIVVLDAPVSSVYSEAVLDHIKEKVPGQVVTAVITTSNAWPHFGGLRVYAARRVPIYGLELNKGNINLLLNASYSIHPDELSTKKMKSQPTYINKRTAIGMGDEKIELIPMFTETGERMMFVYFPAKQLLYTSDMVQPSARGGFFMKQYLSEVIEVVQREKIEVKNVFGMHLPLTAYEKVVEALK